MDFTYLKQFMDHLTSWRIPGNDIKVCVGGKEVFRYQSGYADVEHGEKMTGDRLFFIYSCSKVTTVVAALQLLERGRFLLTDPLYEYLPEYRTMYIRHTDGSITPAKNPITIRDLFTMSAGMSYDWDTAAFRRAQELTGGRMDTRTVIRCLAEDPLSFEPGTHWQYSLCHDVLAAVVEVVSGQKFRDYVKEHIFLPLDMRESCYHKTDTIESRIAPQYSLEPGLSDGVGALHSVQQAVDAQKHTPSFDTWHWKNVGKEASCIFGPEYDSGGGGIITSVDDYSKLVCALANGGIGCTGARILSGASVELLRTNQLSPVQMQDFNWKQMAGYSYGLGVRTMIDPAAGGALSSLGEFGWGGAAGATVLADPVRRLAVFYTHHMLNPQEEYYQPRLRNVIYACLDA